ncbi:maleylpyruvate isomerase family mycothiol-dependent enzyme [Nocardioides aquiterrae]|uniref:Maleylpyruvate isomerase family mycothiol-dependent enzyme n=1 Tax=Nocardioides aquiterrae TaxID=203799 RepID=A0ABP4EXL0_9ACTN
MSELVDRTIAALRTEHDTLVTLLPNLPTESLAAPSGASEWTVAQVLSHLGSGAEIGRAPIGRAAGEDVEPVDNQEVWARWDDSAPLDQAAGFVEHNTRWIETVEALSDEQRATLTVDLGFLPEPVPLVVALGMRLNEVANHSWDVRVALDPSAELHADSADVLVELFRGPLSFILGFSAKPAELTERAAVAVPGAGLVIDDDATIVGGVDEPTATFRGAPEAFIRLLNGRLKDPYAGGATVEGNVTLDDLRRVFPGY